MRTIALLVATMLVVTNSGAQTPLTLDTTFVHFITPEWIVQWNGGFVVKDVALRPDGNLLLTGNQLRPPGTPTGNGAGGVLLVDEHGDYVASEFNSSSGGRITEMLNGQYFYGYKRWNANGTRDLTFGYPDLPYQGTMSHHVLPDRSVLVVGMFKIEEDGLIEYGLIRVDEWGEYDPTYTARKVGPGTSQTVDRIIPVSNDQFILSGTFSTYEGEFSGPIIRINADGTRDPGFYFPAWKGDLYKVYEQPDGKLLLGGRFFMNDVPDTLKLVRVLPDGSLDNTFNNLADYRTNTGPYSAMASGVGVVTPLGDGRIVVGGTFTHVDGEPRGSIACIDTSGNLLDCWAGGGLIPQNYTPSGGPYVGLSDFKCLPNGSCYLFGQYKGFIDANGPHLRQCLMSRIFMPDVGVAEARASQPAILVWPNPGADQLHILVDMANVCTFQLTDVYGRVVMEGDVQQTTTTLNTSNLPSGVYVLLVSSADGTRKTHKWIRS